MIVKKVKPVGIDKVIDQIQKDIYPVISAGFNNLTIYGRVYDKVNEEGVVSKQVYDQNGEYKRVLFSEGNKIFFHQGNTPKIKDGTFYNNLFLCCILKLNERNERNDEQAHQAVYSSLVDSVGTENVVEMLYGMPNLERVLDINIGAKSSRYGRGKESEVGNFKFGDIHPNHVFIVKTNVQYILYNNNC